jgi:hypothetical protein
MIKIIYPYGECILKPFYKRWWSIFIFEKYFLICFPVMVIVAFIGALFLINNATWFDQMYDKIELS